MFSPWRVDVRGTSKSRAAELYFPVVNEETTAAESASGSQWEHGEVRSLQRRDNDGLSVNHSHVLGAHITTRCSRFLFFFCPSFFIIRKSDTGSRQVK